MKRLAGLTAVLLMLLSTGCGNLSGKDSGNCVSVGYFNNVTHAQALYMKATGEFEKALGDGADVNWTAFNAGPAEVEALFADDIDIGYIGPVPAVTANVKSGGNVQILSSATKGGAVLIRRPGTGIEKAADLAGKTVAVPQIGNTQHLCLLAMLSEEGLSPVTNGGTVTVAAVANADVANTMERGDIDAAFVPEPWGATLLEKGAEMVLDYDEVYMGGDYDVAVVVVRRKFLEQHPDIVDIFLEVHSQMTDQINKDTESALKVINQELLEATGKALDEGIIRESFTRMEVSTELNKESISGFAEISKEQGFIADLPEGDGLYVAGIE